MVGSSNTSTRMPPPSQRDSTTFCWLPPEKVLIAGSLTSGRAPTTRRRARASACSRCARDRREDAAALDGGVDEQVLPHRQGQGEAFFLPLAGDEGNAGAHGFGRVTGRERLSRQPHGAAVAAQDAADRPPSRLLPGAAQSGKADDFAGHDVEVERPGILDEQAARRQQRRSGADIPRTRGPHGHASDDQLDEFGRRGFGDRPGGDPASRRASR